MLTEPAATFVAHFGEMGRRWGINRTVGQIYALLYISREPLCADDIAEQLQFSRSNVSMGLKELDSWKLTRVRHRPGDRRDYFTVPEDIWEVVKTLIHERKQREIDPTLSMLRELLLEYDQGSIDEYTHDQLTEMHDLIELLTGWYQDMRQMDSDRLVKLIRMGSRIYKLYEMKDKLTGKHASGGSASRD